MIKLWDDRCVSVIPNTGEIIPLDSNERVKELEAERDRLREAMQKIAEMEAGSHEPSFEMRGCMTSESCMNCDEMIDIARKALEGAGK